MRAEHDTVELGEWPQWQARLGLAVGAFDDRQLEQLYNQVIATYPLNVAFQDILMPLWNELLRHQGRFGQASEWLFFDAFLRVQALQRLQAGVRVGGAPGVAGGHSRRMPQIGIAGGWAVDERDDLAVKVLGMGQPLMS